LAIRYPRSHVSRAIKSLSKSLVDINMVETGRVPVGTAPDKAQREALLASSRLG